MEAMTKSEYIAFLSDKARSAKIATVRDDGRPHVVPIWFMLDGEHLIFTAWHTSIKVKNILHDARVAICVDEDAPPYHYVMIEGQATIMDKSGEASHYWAKTIAERYMGAEKAEELAGRYGKEGEWVFRMIPEKIIAYKNVTD